MKKNNIIKNAVLNALATAIYVIAVASFLFYAPKVFGLANIVLVPIVMLLLFVFSAAFTSFLIFGQPALWYLDGHKKDALSLLALTLVIFLIINLIALFVLFAYLIK